MNGCRHHTFAFSSLYVGDCPSPHAVHIFRLWWRLGKTSKIHLLFQASSFSSYHFSLHKKIPLDSDSDFFMRCRIHPITSPMWPKTLSIKEVFLFVLYYTFLFYILSILYFILLCKHIMQLYVEVWCLFGRFGFDSCSRRVPSYVTRLIFLHLCLCLIVCVTYA